MVVECDVSSDASIDRAFEEVGSQLGGLDIMVHSVAFAPQETFTNRFVDTPARRSRARSTSLPIR